MKEELILELQNLNKSYSDYVALKDINLKVPKGVIYGFIGENGAGKTTTMNIICGLKKASSGKVIFDGKEIGYDEERKEIGYLPQQPKMYPYMRVREYLDFILSLSTVKEENFTADELLEIVGLTHAENRKVKALSGGMLQRLGIAVAICNNPKLVILDEPTSALDPDGRREVMNIIKKLKQKGMTVFFSTHLLTDVENICDYITIVKKGEVVISTTIKDIKNDNYELHYEVKFGSEVEIKDTPKFIKGVKKEIDKTIFLVNKELDDEREIFEYLLTLGAPIKSFVRKESSLEDIFFKLTKGGEANDL